MKHVLIRLAEKFPEPEFSRLQKLVFSEVQEYSPAFAAAIQAEAALLPNSSTPPPGSYSPALRIGAYVGTELVGWSFGWLERGRSFYMANSGVVAHHRRQGIYTELIGEVCEHARSMGAVLLRSQHSVLNNTVLIAKLRFGFHISGLSHSAQMGALAELTYHLSESRRSVLRSRIIPFTADSE